MLIKSSVTVNLICGLKLLIINLYLKRYLALLYSITPRLC